MNKTNHRLKALADPGRLKVLALINAADEICVCKIEQALKLPQPTVSRHLNRLKEAGWVLDRRQGRWMYYRLADEKNSPWRRALNIVLSQALTTPQIGSAKGRKREKAGNNSLQLELEC